MWFPSGPNQQRRHSLRKHSDRACSIARMYRLCTVFIRCCSLQRRQMVYAYSCICDGSLSKGSATSKTTINASNTSNAENPLLVGRIGWGVRVSGSCQKYPPRASVMVRTQPRGSVRARTQFRGSDRVRSTGYASFQKNTCVMGRLGSGRSFLDQSG